MVYPRILLLLACLLFPALLPAQEQPPARVVTTRVVHEEVAENSGFLGLFYYNRSSRVSSEVAGLVENVTVREGDLVKEGDSLLRLDIEMLDKEIEASRIRMAQLELRIDHARKNFERLEKLYGREGVSEKDYDDARYAYEDARKEKQATEKALERLLIEKRKSVITAPFDGVILAKNVEKGEWVVPGRELVRVGSTADLFVRVPVAETLLQFITMGREVEVEINAFQRKLTGTLEDIEPAADPRTKNVFLKVRVPRLPELAGVAENMSATVRVPTSAKRELAMLPRDALIKFQGQDFVYTVRDGKAAMLPVHIVTYLGDRVGADNPHFEPGLAVVIEGNERLRPDQPVTVTEQK